ncbi:MAG TPA: chromate transporter, partial [Treponema sp.]|nr:chromate transporter [Treponema sp.]
GFLQIFNFPALAIFTVSLVVLFKTKVHPVVVVVFGAVFGVVFF